MDAVGPHRVPGSHREPGYAQATGRFHWWWQVLGSNQRRLSRRFYRPFPPGPSEWPLTCRFSACRHCGDQSLSAICPCGRMQAGQCCACSGSCPTESSAVSPCPTVHSWHMQDEAVIDCTQILWIGGDDMQVPLPRAEGN